MSELIIMIIGGVAVAIIVAWLGISSTTKVVVQGTRIKKTGKWIIILSVVMILGGLYLCGQNGDNMSKSGTMYGLVLIIYGVLALIIGKAVAWFQKP